MSAMPLVEPDVPATHRTARTAHRTAPQSRTAVAAPLRLAPPVPSEPAPASVLPGWDLVEVDQRLRHDVQRWTERYVQAALEIVAGERPPTQLARWTRARVHQDLTRRAHLAVRATGRVHPGIARTTAGHPRAQVHSVRLSFLSRHVVEAAVRVRHGERSRAVAARFEWLRGRWVCTALEFC